MRAIMGASLILFTSCGLFGQAAAGPPAFEVASVKPPRLPPATTCVFRWAVTPAGSTIPTSL